MNKSATDYHTHSSYSDGGDMEAMVESAIEYGLRSIGFADHCLISDPEKAKQYNYAMNLDNVERRRHDIMYCNEQYNIEIFDAVEVDYYPDDNPNIETFLESHDFDYAIGAVHELTEVHFPHATFFKDMEEAEKQRYVDTYFEWQVDLIESEIFDIVAHLDIFERNAELRGLGTEEHYHRVAEALDGSVTVPEINGASIPGEQTVLPRTEFVDILRNYGIQFVRGSDAHSPTGKKGVDTRNSRIDNFVAEHDIELVRIEEIV